MDCTNLTADFYYLGAPEYGIGPGESVTIPDEIAEGDERVRSAVARLYASGKISITGVPPAFPISGSTVEFPAHVYSAVDADPAGDTFGPSFDLGADGPRVLTDLTLDVVASDLDGLEHWALLVQSAPTDPATDPSPVFAPSSLAEDNGSGATVTPFPLVVNRYVRLAIGYFQASDVPSHPGASVTLAASFQAR